MRVPLKRAARAACARGAHQSPSPIPLGPTKGEGLCDHSIRWVVVGQRLAVGQRVLEGRGAGAGGGVGRPEERGFSLVGESLQCVMWGGRGLQPKPKRRVLTECAKRSR